jgi:hypothetical protein
MGTFWELTRSLIYDGKRWLWRAADVAPTF